MDIFLSNKFVRSVFIVCFALLVSYLFFTYLFTYLSPFIMAYIVALALEPLICFFERRLKCPRGLASLFGVLIFISIIGSIGAALVNAVWQQALQFTVQFPELLAGGMLLIDEFLNNSHITNILPDWLGTWGDSITLSLAESAQNTIGDGVAQTSLDLFRSLPHFVMWTALFIISTFFFAKDRQLIKEAIVRNSPPELQAWFAKLRTGLAGAFVGYLKAQAFIMSIIATINITALAIHGYEYALFMGLSVAFIDALPLIGSSLIYIPWAVISFLQGSVYSGFFFLALLGVNFLVRQLLEPKVLSASIGLHPIMTLLSIYVGLRLLGPPGLIIGPMWVMAIRIVLSGETYKKPE